MNATEFLAEIEIYKRGGGLNGSRFMRFLYETCPKSSVDTVRYNVGKVRNVSKEQLAYFLEKSGLGSLDYARCLDAVKAEFPLPDVVVSAAAPVEVAESVVDPPAVIAGVGAEKSAGVGAEKSAGVGAEKSAGVGAEKSAEVGAEKPVSLALVPEFSELPKLPAGYRIVFDGGDMSEQVAAAALPMKRETFGERENAGLRFASVVMMLVLFFGYTLFRYFDTGEVVPSPPVTVVFAMPSDTAGVVDYLRKLPPPPPKQPYVAVNKLSYGVDTDVRLSDFVIVGNFVYKAEGGNFFAVKTAKGKLSPKRVVKTESTAAYKDTLLGLFPFRGYVVAAYSREYESTGGRIAADTVFKFYAADATGSHKNIPDFTYAQNGRFVKLYVGDKVYLATDFDASLERLPSYKILRGKDTVAEADIDVAKMYASAETAESRVTVICGVTPPDSGDSGSDFEVDGGAVIGGTSVAVSLEGENIIAAANGTAADNSLRFQLYLIDKTDFSLMGMQNLAGEAADGCADFRGNFLRVVTRKDDSLSLYEYERVMSAETAETAEIGKYELKQLSLIENIAKTTNNASDTKSETTTATAQPLSLQSLSAADKAKLVKKLAAAAPVTAAAEAATPVAAPVQVTGFAFASETVYIESNNKIYAFDTSNPIAPTAVQDPDISNLNGVDGTLSRFIPWTDNATLRISSAEPPTLAMYRAVAGGAAERTAEIVLSDTEDAVLPEIGAVSASPSHNFIIVPLVYPGGDEVTRETVYKFVILSYDVFKGFVNVGTVSEQNYDDTESVAALVHDGYIFISAGSSVKTAANFNSGMTALGLQIISEIK